MKIKANVKKWPKYKLHEISYRKKLKIGLLLEIEYLA
jgi:hypothetical protein